MFLAATFVGFCIGLQMGSCTAQEIHNKSNKRSKQVRTYCV